MKEKKNQPQDDQSRGGGYSLGKRQAKAVELPRQY